ncbi:M20/M25/M40 family metallo-hydrolase [Thermococcus sp. SY098]|uniref:M20/M25/M40 family metallo-hydrolase n=1 Tax=Thermococcus sp. SY098 TaxID=3111325 RepID=UPI002D7939FA|nr:M20/M25/M40 family metallo-hydrolase [Thermococcus sp. SY098]WRS52730.1 M20/M25/M40 family metallo-hydrolase [Thermococcus sp. SY098]
MMELLSQLIEFETVNDPAKGKKPDKECPKFIRDTLNSWGIESEIIEKDGYYAVYGEIGEGTPKIMFMAHFDVVPVNVEEWKTDPFKLTVVGNKAYGRGSADDKGNVAGIMLALRELSTKRLGGRVIFAFTGDEEIGGKLAMHIAEKLKEENKLPQYLINADGAGMNPIIRRRKGFGAVIEIPQQKITIRGKVMKRSFTINTPVLQTRHAAYFMPGVDMHPMVALSHFLRNSDVFAVKLEGKFLKSNVLPSRVELTYVEPCESGEEVEADLGLTELLKSIVPLVRAPISAERYSDFGVSVTPNLYSFENGVHRLRLDIRAMSHSSGQIEKVLKEILEFNIPNAKLTVRHNEKAGYLFTPPDSKLVRAMMKTLESFGEKAKPVEGAGASDSRYFTPYGVESIDFGPRGGNVHGPNEYADVDSLELLPKIYAEVAMNLLKK